MFLCRYRLRNEEKPREIWRSHGVDFDEMPTAGYNKVSCYSAQYLYFWLFINLLKPTCYVMHHQFNIQQLYILPTLYLCVLYLSQNKQRLV
jgi:hypothetical protein